jgi:adenylate cyclase
VTSINRQLASILVADVVGYVRMMEREEERTFKLTNAIIVKFFHPMIRRYQGVVVKSTGDGLIASFPSVLEAFRCALIIQRRLARRPARKNVTRPIFRIGLNVGDVINQNGDLFGECVNIAVRIESLAPPGGICVSSAVYEQVRHKVSVGFDSIGRPSLKPFRILPRYS